MASLKKCSCIKHEEYTKESTVGNVIKTNAKKIKKAVIDALILRGDIYQHSKFLCQGCVNFAEHNFLQLDLPASKKSKIDISEEAVQCVLDLLQKNECTLDQQQRLVHFASSILKL